MANITIYGSTGMVGSDITREALSRGHRVTGVTRQDNPSNPIDGVTYVTGDINDPADVAAKAQDADIVVLSVPGPRDGSSVQPIVDAHAALIGEVAAASDAEADAASGARLFVVGGAGATLTAEGTMLVDTPDFPEAYAAEARSFAEVLDLYRAAPEELDWTMLAPAPEIGPGAPGASYVLGDDHPAGDSVTTGTFARAALDEIERPAHRRARYTVADA
ncbi:NAD(P)-dependent oxidoreductase [Corynebacterium sp. AOP40-9SA-29]|uniref:NAD(P)-dependent oxidoreductase n=1 Tax=Corynebacterium sp. AOP40-9SA-29 TaxID=3457677 RepID=UPI004034F258